MSDQSPLPSRQLRRAELRKTYRRRRMVIGASLLALLVLAGVTVLLLGSGGATSRSTTATTSKRPATTTTAATNSVTMAFVGDTMLGNTPALPPNAATYFSSVASALNVPTVFANLEGTITDSASSGKCAGSTPGNCYAFRNPTSYAPLYRSAGFTVMNSANNHSHDFGSTSDTTSALQAAGIAQTGLPGQIAYVTQGTTKIAVIGFAPYSNANNMLDFAAAATLIGQAKAHAQLVVVYMHAGAEGSNATHVTGATEVYVGEDRGNAKAFAHAAIDAGANLVVASGPHVLRGMEWYKGVLINYSLANFAGYKNFATSYPMSLTGVLTVTLASNGRFESGHFTPVTMSGDGQPFIGGGSIGFVNALSSTDFGFSGVYIQGDGTIYAPSAK